jgi:hypothetical protein
MSKTYKIKLNQGQGEAKFLDIPQAGGAGNALTVKAVAGGKYQLVDASTGYAPENIRAMRSGKNLLVFFEGRNTADLMIENYYEVMPEGFNGLIGEAESGRFYEFIPETAVGFSTVAMLAEGSAQVGMALGGAEVFASGAAVGTLVAAAGLNPLFLAPLALLGAGGGGGGGKAPGPAPDTTPPEIKSAQLLPADDSGPKDNVTNDTTPRIEVQTEPNADVSVEVAGKTYTGKADDKGLALIQIPDADALKDGTYTPKVTASDAAGNKAQFDGTPFTVSTGNAESGMNVGAVVDIKAIDADSGANKTDFYTNDNQLIFSGTVKAFAGGSDWLKLDLKDLSGQVIDSQYVKPVAPVAPATDWTWSWDRTAKSKLTDGKYELTASVVDGAGNVVGKLGALVTDVQSVTIDTDKDHNFGVGNPGKEVDPNKSGKISIDKMDLDSGFSSTDFVTQDRTHVYSGKLTDFTNNGALVEVSLKDATGKVLASDYVVPKLVADQWTWTWDQIANTLKDGEYSLSASLVDKAGNVIISDDPQPIVVDNSANNNGPLADPNVGLKMLPMVFSDDTGLKNTDYLTKDQSIIVQGPFDKDFVNNGDKVLVQIFAQDGKLINQQHVQPEGKNWVFVNEKDLGQKDETSTYTIKSSLVDAAGNTLQATSQSFIVDLFTSVMTPNSTQGSNNVNKFSSIDFSANERGSYTFTTGPGTTISKQYEGGVFQMKEIEGKVFSAGQFKLDFTDWAGNVKTISNDDRVWDFSDAKMPINPPTNTLPVPGFDADQLVGSVGKLVLPTSPKEFDMASLYDGMAAIGETVAVNHVDMAQGVHTLELTMGDVLKLGVKNSFSASAAHKGKLQMLVDGDLGDKLLLDDLVGETDFDWVSNNSVVSLDGKNYNAYTQESLGLSLFVNTAISINMV